MDGEKQKVGILSMQRVANYGSFMQAWALRRILEELGADVRFIDITPGRRLPGYGAGKAQVYLKRLSELTAALFTGRLGAKLRGRRFYRAMRARYEEEYYGMLGLDMPAHDRYDLAVIGSDQVFNCLQASPWGFTTQLYGNIPQAGKVISYAGSFGDASYEGLLAAGVADEIAAALGRMTEISVRDDNSRDIVLKLTGRRAHMHLDPALVYDFSRETEGRSPGRRDYIVIYSYTGRISDKAEIAAIRAFARRHGKRLIALFSAYDWCDESVIPDTPFDVLAWFRDADYVITDTFHGTVFSVVTHGRFCTLARSSNISRTGPLLRQLVQEGRMTANPGEIAGILETAPDYTLTDRMIREEKTRTREYLAAAMGIDTNTGMGMGMGMNTGTGTGTGTGTDMGTDTSMCTGMNAPPAPKTRKKHT